MGLTLPDIEKIKCYLVTGGGGGYFPPSPIGHCPPIVQNYVNSALLITWHLEGCWLRPIRKNNFFEALKVPKKRMPTKLKGQGVLGP